jgi:hypothetical protein
MDVFYYVLTMNWIMLDRIQFDFIELVIEDHILDFSQSELRLYVSHLNFSQEEILPDPESVEKFMQIKETLKRFIKSPIVYFPVFRNINQVLNPTGFTISDLIARRKSIDNPVKAYIFENLVFEMQEIEDRMDRYANTKSLREFKILCNKYLQETKFDIDASDNSSVININNNEYVEIASLSSGEKQILNFFARTYLADDEEIIVLIDEPEISLSINWQKTLLPDIICSNKCSLLFVITHSPFIFKNTLDKYAVPMNLYTNKIDANSTR